MPRCAPVSRRCLTLTWTARLRRASWNHSATASANASVTSSCRTSATFPRRYRDGSLPPRSVPRDGVELHYAHAYTIASFLSRTNDRDDGYGRTLEGRLRLPLEVFARVRESVGKSFVVGCRFLTEECIEGGSPLDDARAFGVAFARAGMDFSPLRAAASSTTRSNPPSVPPPTPNTGPSGYECIPQYVSDAQGPFGRNATPTKGVRDAARAAGFATPVVCTGGVHNFEVAERWLANGVCDIVGAARQSLADPDWALKIHMGRGGEVRTCEFTNYCEGLDQKHKQVTCQLWDRKRLHERGVMLAGDGKRRLVAPD